MFYAGVSHARAQKPKHEAATTCMTNGPVAKLFNVNIIPQNILLDGTEILREEICMERNCKQR